jgi:hypothetical protein
MPGTSRETATCEDHGPVEDRHAELDGYTVNFVTFTIDMDGTPLLKGLPDDRCQCPHWGYVFKGKVTFRFADHDEVYGPGDAFYAPPGHIPVHEAESEYLQFSPAEELALSAAQMTKNMQALQQS